jgi:hypothetical protein
MFSRLGSGLRLCSRFQKPLQNVYSLPLHTSSITMTNTNSNSGSKRSELGYREIVPQTLSITEKLLGGFTNILLSPLHLVGYGFIMVQPNWVKVTTYWGKYTGVHYNQGTSWRFSVVGLKAYDVYLGQQSARLQNSNIVDSGGCPLVVSSMFNYNIVKPEQAILGVDDVQSFVTNQCDSVLKNVVSKYSYDTLRSDSVNISSELIDNANKVLSCAGVNVSSFRITDINYAKEIAQSMLVKQQADAYLAGKTQITKAATSIIDNTVKYYGDVLTKEDKADLIKKLLIIITSGSSVQTTLPLDK